MKEWLPEAHKQLMDILRTLEKHYKDMQDTEFTVEEGQLFMLQTRNAKRPAQAAVRFACDAVDEGLLNKEEALATIDPGVARRAAAPDLRPQGRVRGAGHGRHRLAGRGEGRGRLHRRGRGRGRAGRARRDPRAARSPRPTTSPASTPPRASSPPRAARPRTPRWWRAAWAARRWSGRRRWRSTSSRGCITVDGTKISEGDRIAIDGTKGCVTLEDVPLVDPEVNEYFERVLEWADEIRRLGVRANADTPEDADEGARAGRRGHRPVPDRAHVHGRGPPAEDAGDDHGRRRGGPARGAGRAAARSSRRTSRACSRR